MDLTPNYNLKKPLGTENYDVATQNQNMDAIDAAIKAAADAAAAAETPIGAQAKADAAGGAAVIAAGLYTDQEVATLDTAKINHSLATAISDFLVASGPGEFVKKTLAEVKTILGLGTAAYTASSAYATAAEGILATNALPKGGGTMTGVLTAQVNTSYTTTQVRNIKLGTTDPAALANGEVYIKYIP